MKSFDFASCTWEYLKEGRLVEWGVAFFVTVGGGDLLLNLIFASWFAEKGGHERLDFGVCFLPCEENF